MTHSLATEEGSHRSLLGDHALPAEETLTLSMAGDHSLAMEEGSHRSLLGDPFPTSGGNMLRMAGDPFPSNGGDIFKENAR